MTFGLTPEEIKAIHGVFQQFPEIGEVVIFGSRAMGNFKTASDIDLALKGKTLDLTMVAKIKALLEETIPLPYFFDLVDFNAITSQELLQHIRQYGRCFYKKK